MIEDFYSYKPYELNSGEKNEMLTKELISLTDYHRSNCDKYDRFLRAISYNKENVHSIEDIPFFPVRMFKDYELLSVSRNDIFKIMTSSGTTGQSVSKIFVDKNTAMTQQKVMTKILSDFWGKKRLPMLIVDSPKVLKDRTMFSARGAAIIGLQVLSREMVFALNEDMTPNMEQIISFLDRYSEQPFVIFGFTFMVWQHLYMELKNKNTILDMSNAWLMTGGGWKKLQAEAISREEFKRRVQEQLKIHHFLDHYGMVEQTGCIYAECEYGHLHASNYSDVIIRDYHDFSPCKKGEKGIIQVVSILPHSYPGHSLLTEDEGIIIGEDDCPCGRKGKYIEILGRIKNAELRGCSDTYANGYV